MEKVTNKEVIEALEYFIVAGYIDQLRRDEKYFTEILIKFAAQKCNIEVEL